MKKQYIKPNTETLSVAQTFLATISGGDFKEDEPGDRAKRMLPEPLSDGDGFEYELFEN